MDTDTAAFLAVVLTASVAYSRALGATQCQIAAWVIAAFRTPSRWRGLVNLGVGVALATAVSVVAAWQAGNWGLLPAGVLAGVLASVEAAKVHDDAAAKEKA